MSNKSNVFHIGKNGPAPCNAKKRACRYGSHYDSMDEAFQEFEKEMDSELLQSESRKKSNVERSVELEKVKKLLESEDFSKVENINKVGALISLEIESRTGISFGKEDYSKEEREVLSEHVSIVLKELQGEEIQFTAKINGRFSKNLKEAIAVFPSGANSLVVNPIYTELIRRNNMTHDGFHSAQAFVYAPTENSFSNFGRNGELAEGDFAFSDNSIRAEDFEKDLIGCSVDKITRPAGRLKAGESLIPFLPKVYRSEDKFLELMKDGVLNSSGELIEGQEESFRIRAPELSNVVESINLSESYYIGRKPGGSSKAKKVSDSVEVKDSSGKVSRIDKTLWKIEDKKVDYNAHTIAAKADWDGKPVPSILAHEFVHAIQSRPGNIPGEKEMFQNIYPTGELKERNGYKYFDSFPDEYMGDQGGRELFTRASEGLFYSTQADTEPFMFTDKNNGKIMRDWALGAWAVLSERGVTKQNEIVNN